VWAIDSGGSDMDVKTKSGSEALAAGEDQIALSVVAK